MMMIFEIFYKVKGNKDLTEDYGQVKEILWGILPNDVSKQIFAETLG